MKKCLVIGATMLNLTLFIDWLPSPGDNIYGQSQTMALGGCAYNVADILKHFKIPYDLFAPVGTGVYADIITRKLTDAGHKSLIKSSRQDNGYFLCLAEPDGEKTFVTLPGIECNYEPEWFDLLNPSEYDCVYVSGEEIERDGGEHIIRFLENNPDLTVYYAPGPRLSFISCEKQKRMEALHPILHITEEQALCYSRRNSYEKAAEALYKKYQNTVMITLGSKGVYLKDRKTLLIKSSPVNTVNMAGVEDAHVGAVIALTKLGLEPEQALAEANHISSIVMQIEGSTLNADAFTEQTVCSNLYQAASY